jgi:hypothetical protein
MIEVMGEVSPEAVAFLEPVVTRQRSLEEVTRWALFQKPALVIERIVVQDEYTHDVVLRVKDRVYLVYDST